MCINNVQNLVNHPFTAAQRLSFNTADVVEDAADSGRIPNAGEVASVVDDEVVDAATAAFQAAVDVFTDHTNWGEAVRIDQGEDPRYFGYGESKETRSEQTVGSAVTTADGGGPFGLPTPDVVHELAAKLRGFGHDDPEGISASRGVETEVGYRARTEPGRLAGVDPLFAGLGVVSKTDLSALVGAAAEASASLDVTGLSIVAEAFAGARAGIQQGFTAA